MCLQSTVCFPNSSFNVCSHTLPPTSSASVEKVGVSELIHGSVSPPPCPAAPLVQGGDSFPESKNVSQDLLPQQLRYLGAAVEDHHPDH